MFGRKVTRISLVVLFVCSLILLGQSPDTAGQSPQPENLFANPGFELGSDGWQLSTGGSTQARFAADGSDAFAGQQSGLVTVGKVDDWGVQFGQSFEAGTRGKTYTFAVAAKRVGKPVTVTLQIERRAKPWDRAAQSERFTLEGDDWTELHVTFTVDKPFPEGWFAYVSCTEPNSQLRLDAFRLYGGEYVPYREAAREQLAAIQVSLFDTGVASPGAFAPEDFANKQRWTRLPEDETDHAFRGDAVFMNDRLAAVLRRGAPGAEVYSLGQAGASLRAVLAPIGDSAGSVARLASVDIVENTPGAVAVNATFKAGGPEASGGDSMTVGYELGMGRAFVQTEPGPGATGLRLGAPCRFLVLPDFFADDIVIDATRIPVPRAELPSEHFLLHMLPGGRAIVMSVSDADEQDVTASLSGEGAERVIDGSDIRYGKRGKIWVAVIEGGDDTGGVWTVREIAAKDAGCTLPLDWCIPYPAQWRVDWTQSSGLVDSWEMIAEQPGGQYEKHGWFGQPNTIDRDRLRWTTVLGRFEYPCWVDRQGRAFLEPLAKRARFEGPAIIYPINRTRRTPLAAFTVVDLVRATLGVGPCEYVLDVEGQGATMKGRATCATRDTLNPIYEAGRQKQERATIERALDEVLVFVTHIRSRIDGYVQLGHEIRDYLAAEKKAHPELADFISEMDSLARAIDERFEARKDIIRTPQYVAELTDKFRKTLLDYQGADAAARCKEITAAIVTVGGNQDELVGECRLAVKVLRQRAGLAMATDPRTAEIAQEIRRRTQQALRNSSTYEAPRH